MGVEELKREARQLPEGEKADIISGLLSTFPSAEYDVSDAEVALRIAETESGEVQDISYEELKATILERGQK